jgi:transcription elongation factor Elf1
MSGVAALRNPDCPYNPALCRIARVVAPVEPALEWTIIYDGNGNATNVDPNVYIATSACTTCGQSWEVRWTGAEPPVYRKVSDG